MIKTEKLRVYTLENDREKVLSLFKNEENTGINYDALKNTFSSIDVVVFMDCNGCLLDYRVFDPFRLIFNGYLNPNGWSHWMNDYLSSETYYGEYGFSDEEKELIESWDF